MSTLHRIGLDGRRVPLRVRERWALTDAERADLYERADEHGWGLVALATCHRVEVYLDAPAEAVGIVQSWLADRRPALDASALDAVSGEDALRHLFRVSSGLESAVLGEAQILGQVRRARAEAERAGALTPLLREAFGAAVGVGRTARARTAIGRGVASTASAAVGLASRTAGGLRGRHVVVVGGGEIGRLLLKHVAGAAPARLDLVSRSADVPGVACHAPDMLPAFLREADIVFTGTDRVVVRPEDLVEGRALTVVDLGVPRNVDARVADVPGVTLHDVDALRDAVGAGLAERRAAVPAAEQIVDDALGAFAETADRVRREELVADVRRRAERTRQAAVAAVCGQCPDRTCMPTTCAEVVRPGPGPCSDPEQLTRTLTTRLLHDVTRGLRETLDLDDAALRRLFAVPDASRG